MSGTVDPVSLRNSLGNWRAIGCGLFLQFLILPFIGFLCVRTFLLPPTLGLTLLVVTSSPGGSYSNWWCSIFNASLSLSVTMTAVSTVLSSVFLPLNLLIYANLAFESNIVKELKWGAMFLSIGVVVVAIGTGLYGSYRSMKHRSGYKFQYVCNRVGNISGVLLVIFSAVISSLDPKGAIWNRDGIFYVAVASPCMVGVLVSVGLSTWCKLEKPERVTVSVECCYQNVGIAQSIAISMFSGPELADAIGVPLYYGIVEAIILGLFCVVCWKVGWTKAPKDENFCVVVSTNYEVDLAEMRDEGQEVIYGMEHELQLGYDEDDGVGEGEGGEEAGGEDNAKGWKAWSPRNVGRYVRDSIFGTRRRETDKSPMIVKSASSLGSPAMSFQSVLSDDPDEIVQVVHARTVDWKSTFDLEDDGSESSVPYVPPTFTPPRLPRLTTEELFVRTKSMGVDEHGKVFPTFKSSPSSLLFNLGIVEQSIAVCLDDMIDKVELRSSVKVKTREGQLRTEEEEREDALRKRALSW